MATIHIPEQTDLPPDNLQHQQQPSIDILDEAMGEIGLVPADAAAAASEDMPELSSMPAIEDLNESAVTAAADFSDAMPNEDISFHLARHELPPERRQGEQDRQHMSLGEVLKASLSKTASEELALVNQQKYEAMKLFSCSMPQAFLTPSQD